jgi:hypothetical protein
MAIEFYLGEANSLDWLEIDSPIGIIDGQTTGNIPITFDAGECHEGEYLAILRLLTNDSEMLVNEIPVTLMVGTVDIADNNSNLPCDFILHPSFPNPFNAQTLISYSLPEPMTISLKAYNLMGQEVAQLYTGYCPAGEYSVTWDASRLSSGIYFLKLSGNDLIRNQRVILLK